MQLHLYAFRTSFTMKKNGIKPMLLSVVFPIHIEADPESVLTSGYFFIFIMFIKNWSSKNVLAAPVAEWLRSLTSVLLIIRSSHRCGFAPRSGHESHVGQAKFCLLVCQVVFPRVLRFSPHLPIDPSRYE